MQIETIHYLDEGGKLDSSFGSQISDETLVKAYQTMLRNRHIDARMINLQRQGQISFAMSSLGEECCSVGAAAALDLGDWIYPQYREAGALFWRGFSTQDYLHQMFCNGKDLIKGRQMPNHFGSRELNVVTVSSPIGTKLPHAAGCGYAMKLQAEPHVALAFFGEGAASEGDFHAALNFAAVREAPTIFFCRNNGYAISTRTIRQYHGRGIADYGHGYGIKSVRVDGNDFFAVHQVVTEAKKYCLEGKGPVLIEAMTYRMGAHSTSDDPTRYREKQEMEEWKKKDPVARLRRYLESKKLWSEEQEEKYSKRLYDEVTEAIEVAKKTPPPPLHSLVEDVYHEVPEPLERQVEELKKWQS